MSDAAPGARVWHGYLVLVALAATAGGGAAAAQEPMEIVGVEEDWELVVAAPDADSVAPQATCIISPVGHADGIHAAFELNQQTLPEFVPGGLQLQVWNGETAVAERKAPSWAVLTRPETIRWTQAMTLDQGQLTFKILNGDSITWGDFGGAGHFVLSVPVELAHLNGYSPEVSAAGSGVGYAENRVTSLVLKRVRLKARSGERVTVELNKSVYPKP